MNNIKLQLVSFEQAKALEELGLPHLDHEGFCYKKDGTLTQPIYTGEWCNTFAPTLELVAKWLREEKDIYIEPCIIVHEYLLKVLIKEYNSYEEEFEVCRIQDKLIYYNTYEEALSAGIDKAIEILKKNDSINN